MTDVGNTHERGRPVECLPRPRLPVLAAGMAVLWPVGWYSTNGDFSLLVMVAACMLVSLLPSRPLVRSVRAAIWGGVLAGVLLLAANIGRIFPPEEGLDPFRRYLADRAVTVALVPALMALFTAFGRHAATAVATGTLPMVMLVLVRRDPAYAGLFVWTALGLPLLADQLRRLYVRRSEGEARSSRRERWTRLAGPAALLLAGALLAGPLAIGANKALEWAYGSLNYNPRRSRRSRDLSSLSLRVPPGGFADRVRLLMTLRAPVAPGYLREAIFRDFIDGEWIRRVEIEVLEPLEGADAKMDYGRAFYRVSAPDKSRPSVDPPWELVLLSAYRDSVICLPPHVHALDVDAAAGLVRDVEGIVSWEQIRSAQPVRMHVEQPDAQEKGQHGLEPLTGTAAISAPPERYLDVPAAYRRAVSAWIYDCVGLREAETPREAMAAVVNHFHTTFTYSLSGPSDRQPDLLTAFMRERQGHCTLFATAATLMLRARGVPARVVGGYVCHEQHPLTRRWVVRERDGHAWCEAWDAVDEVWRLVEATPPAGLPLELREPGMLRLMGELFGSLWRGLIDTLQQTNPLVLLVEAVAMFSGWVVAYLIGPSGVVGVLVLLAAIGLYIRRRQRRLSDIDERARIRAALIRTMHRLERHVVKGALRRLPAESWAIWQRRVSPSLPPAERETLQTLVEDYQRLRYHPRLDAEAASTWLERVRGIVSMRARRARQPPPSEV